MSNSDAARIDSSIAKVLSSHGFGFQYAVIRRLHQLHTENRSRWVFLAAEVPVSLSTQSTHADFVLRSKNEQIVLVGECKRVNPSQGWFFAHAPYTSTGQSKSELCFDRIAYKPANLVDAGELIVRAALPAYHVAHTIREQAEPRETHESRSAISDGTSQVLRAQSGLINTFFPKNLMRSFDSASALVFLPVIFTTAKLYTTETDLGDADLIDGKVDLSQIRAQRVPWLWFVHNRSPSLTHAHFGMAKWQLQQAMRRDFARAIAVVSAEGLDEFCSVDIEAMLDT